MIYRGFFLMSHELIKSTFYSLCSDKCILHVLNLLFEEKEVVIGCVVTLGVLVLHFPVYSLYDVFSGHLVGQILQHDVELEGQSRASPGSRFSQLLNEVFENFLCNFVPLEGLEFVKG